MKEIKKCNWKFLKRVVSDCNGVPAIIVKYGCNGYEDEEIASDLFHTNLDEPRKRYCSYCGREIYLDKGYADVDYWTGYRKN